jgi:hypothetical protein
MLIFFRGNLKLFRNLPFLGFRLQEQDPRFLGRPAEAKLKILFYTKIPDFRKSTAL